MSTKPARQSLAALPFERKVPAGAPVAAPVEPAAETAPAERQAQPAKAKDEDGKVPVMVRMRPADRKLIRQIAIGLDTTVQGLLEEAITDIIRRHRGAMNL